MTDDEFGALLAVATKATQAAHHTGSGALKYFLNAADEAGLTHLVFPEEPFGYVNMYTGQFFMDVEPSRKNNEGHWVTVYTADQLAAAVADAVAAERERCAQVCDRVALAWDGEEAPDGGYVAKQCSDAVRAGDGEASND